MDVVEIIDGQPGDYSLMWYFVPHADHIRIGGWSWDGLNLDPGTHVIAYFTLRANNTGTSDIWHVYCHLDNQYGMALPNQVWNNGAFGCPCPVPYNISGYTFDNNGDPEIKGGDGILNKESFERAEACEPPRSIRLFGN